MRTRTRLYLLESLMVGIIAFVILSLAFHLGAEQGLWGVEPELLNLNWLFCSVFILLMVHLRPRSVARAELWSGRERVAWTLIGVALLLVGIGGYILIYTQTEHVFVISWVSFSLPSLCFASARLLIFLGLLFLPSSVTGSRRIQVLLDSLISAGSLFAVGWFLLLGPLTLAPEKPLVFRLLNAYTPTANILNISYVLYLLLSTVAFFDSPGYTRQDKLERISAAYRVGLLVLCLGLILVEGTVFLVNIRLQLGVYRSAASWTDVGWITGALTIALAAYLRRFLPALMNERQIQRVEQLIPRLPLDVIQYIPYLLGLLPMLVLILNVFSDQPDQEAIRPVLTITTLVVISLVLIRQIITMRENERLIHEQEFTLEQLERASRELARQMALQAELNVAAKIQSQLLPQRLPDVTGLDIFAYSQPAEQVGGDFYDVFARPDAPFVFALGDISGHGLPAALLMTMTRTIFHTATHSLSMIDPQAILERTNGDLYEDFTEVGMFVTMFVGYYNPLTCLLIYANAGQSPILYCPKGRSAILLKADAPALGVLPTCSCTDHLLSFHEGDILLVGTDGLNESFNAQGEMFGYERLLKTVESLAHLSASELGVELLKTIEQFTRGYQQSDDRTFLILKGMPDSCQFVAVDQLPNMEIV